MISRQLNFTDSFIAFLCVFLAIFSLGFSDIDEWDEMEKVEAPLVFIPLGSDCMPTKGLKKIDLRERSYPFDWIFSHDTDQLIRLLNDDFANFLSPEHLLLEDPDFMHYTPIPVAGNPVKNTCYSLHFWHDEFQTDFEAAVTKYQRRIDRFRDLANHEGKVVFVRIAQDWPRFPEYHWYPDSEKITASQAEGLKNALEKLFPTLDFLLVIVNYTWATTVPPITGIDKVLEYKVGSFDKHGNFKKIYTELQSRFSNLLPESTEEK